MLGIGRGKQINITPEIPMGSLNKMSANLVQPFGYYNIYMSSEQRALLYKKDKFCTLWLLFSLDTPSSSLKGTF